jgi:energy-converting hydrogenase Eha subunit C
MVATRFAKAVNIGVVAIVGVWHLGMDTLLVLKGWPVYEPRAAAAGAWLALTVIQTVGSVLLLRSALSARTAWMLAAAALVTGVVAAAAYPPGGAIGNVSWAGNTVGWFGVLLLIQRPLWELITLLAANMAVMVGFLAADGALDQATVSHLLAVVYTTAGIQLTFAYLARQLNDGAREATEIAAAQAEHLARATADETVHAERRRRYEYLRIRAEPLLRGLAGRQLDPGDAVVRRRAAVEAARLRRLFAETDDTPHPLLHELRACADVAERRGVRVTLLSYGDLPGLPSSVRRELTEGALLVLAGAATQARVTVVTTPEEVVVSVVADAPPDTLVEPPGSLTVSSLYDQEEDQWWWETRWPVRPTP